MSKMSRVAWPRPVFSPWPRMRWHRWAVIQELTTKGGRCNDNSTRRKMTQDFIAAAQYLKAHPACSGKVGVVGFCFGGGMSNELAVRIPKVISAAVPFYGRQPAAGGVPKIKARLLIHYAELDERINVGWPAYEAALKEADIDYAMHMYPGVNHGFHNDTTPRYDEAAAKLAWERTISFFNETLKAE